MPHTRNLGDKPGSKPKKRRHENSQNLVQPQPIGSYMPSSSSTRKGKQIIQGSPQTSQAQPFSTPINPTPTGHGGYIGTVTMSPKETGPANPLNSAAGSKGPGNSGRSCTQRSLQSIEHNARVDVMDIEVMDPPC